MFVKNSRQSMSGLEILESRRSVCDRGRGERGEEAGLGSVDVVL